MEFTGKAAELIYGFRSQAQREIYAERAAKAAGITKDAMLLEAERAFQKRASRERRRQEKEDLSPAVSMLPKDRSLRSAYRNTRSSRAEEEILAQLLMAPELLEKADGLTGSEFSVAFLGRAFDALSERFRAGLQVSLAVLEGFSAEEMARLSAISQESERIVDERAFLDCVRVVREEAQKTRSGNTSDELMALSNDLKARKGYGGNERGTK